MTEDRCQFCKWWNVQSDRREQWRYSHNDCRRRAPVARQMISGSYIGYQNFPQTGGDDFCGEFERCKEPA